METRQQAMIIIDCECGRIGNLWWINSEPGTPITRFVPLTIGIIDTGMVIKRRLIRWGSFGFGRNLRLTLEPIDD